MVQVSKKVFMFYAEVEKLMYLITAKFESAMETLALLCIYFN